ncbi:hypothetical protein [Bradyrhizobium uaiense]|uniref:Uncharacterized protein n=1 Tax=Bradyrhizobium uaiense TaxID=2594946 RepID=A0A6P1BFN2_9BRAD|nr:hypothetical protein [Bradyrhizobium uaiense]NEU96984.1 hypothetical protein [Bradyrhizobium uaiense]
MSNSTWTEFLRCPRCQRTGHAQLSEVTPFRNRIDLIPEGFEIRRDERSSDFQRATCRVPVLP